MCRARSHAPERGTLFVVYPLIPWIGVMAAGYAFGACSSADGASGAALLLRLGAGAHRWRSSLLRALNGYGDPRPGARSDAGV